MSTRPSTAFRIFSFSFSFIFIAAVCCAWLAGCAVPGLLGGGPNASPFSNPTLSMQSASDSITVGKSSKADVLAALGAATVINFDSGYEVWVYRAKSREPAEATAEFVILFSPDGVVKKTRLRPGYVVNKLESRYGCPALLQRFVGMSDAGAELARFGPIVTSQVVLQQLHLATYESLSY